MKNIIFTKHFLKRCRERKLDIDKIREYVFNDKNHIILNKKEKIEIIISHGNNMIKIITAYCSEINKKKRNMNSYKRKFFEKEELNYYKNFLIYENFEG